MICLTKQEIEVIGNELIVDFIQKSTGGKPHIDIEGFAEGYLGLNSIYTKLSDTGELLGLTTFAGVELTLARNGGEDTLLLDKDTVLVEEALLDEKCAGRRRFTIAHECGHQIIDRLEEERTGVSVRARFKKGQAYSCREVAGAFNWSEWQANCMAAVLLMPPELVCQIVHVFRKGEKVKHFGWRGFERQDVKCMTGMAGYIGVSYTALRIRLGELGYIEEHPESEFRYSPYDILCDEDSSVRRAQ